MLVYLTAMYVFPTNYVILVKNIFIVVVFMKGLRKRIATNQQIIVPLAKTRFDLKVHFSHMYMN
jgi:hypothetical protein